MSKVARYDIHQLGKPETTSQGFLRAPAGLTRSGIFAYRNPDGTTRVEYRPPEEVFHADSMASFEDAPVTDGHPARLLDSRTATKHAVGYVKDTPRRDGNVVASRIVVQDAAVIDAVVSGKKRGLSCGYECDYDPTPGVTPDGERYDGVQRNIRGNHLAVVKYGRAGPEATIRLDEGDAVMVTDSDPKKSPEPRTPKDKAMPVKVNLDGITYTADDQLAQAVTVSIDKLTKRIDGLETQVKEQQEQISKQTARADTAEADAKKAKERADELEKPDRVQELVKARTDLERVAGPILGDEVKMDEMDDAAIKKAVVAKVYPEAKLDDKDAVYIQASFDRAVEKADATPNPALGATRKAATTAPDTRADSITKFYADEAEAWQKPSHPTT